MISIHFAVDTHSDLIGFPKDVLQGAPLRISLDSLQDFIDPFQTFCNGYPLDLISIVFMCFARDTPYDFIDFLTFERGCPEDVNEFPYPLQ